MKPLHIKILEVLMRPFFKDSIFASRYKPDTKWMHGHWTQNLVLAYYRIFWRRFGIRPDLHSYNDGVRVIYSPQSFLALLSHVEFLVRRILIDLKIPKIIFAPQVVLSNGMAMPSPYMFAIALDAVDVPDGGVGTDLTHAHIGTGANLASTNYVMGDGVTGVTYNAVTMDTPQSQPIGVARNFAERMSYLSNVASGSINIVVSKTGSANRRIYAITHTGVVTGAADNSGHIEDQVASMTWSITLAPVASNCWIVSSFVGAGGATLSDGTNGKVRSTAAASGRGLADTNGAVSGSTTCSVGANEADIFSGFAVSLAPVGGNKQLMLTGVGI